MTYHVDRLRAAVTVLVGDGHIKQRLVRAYQNHIEAIRDDELPAELRTEFEALRAAMHRVAPLNGEGPVRASVRKMSVEDASDCAISVLTMYGAAMRLAGDRQDSLPLDDQTDNVPAFLVKSAS